MNRETKSTLLGILGFLVIVVVVLFVWANVNDMTIVELIRSWIGSNGGDTARIAARGLGFCIGCTRR